MSCRHLTYRTLLLIVAIALFRVPAWADWPPIPPEDLKLTELPEQKGAAAFVLLRDELADDINNYHSVYMRIKILTESGRRYADVEIPYSRRNFTVEGISGRTIHADGTIVAFNGQAFDRMVLRARRGHTDEVRIHVKVFTLPDVQVGSIIEYRYSLRYGDRVVYAPEWIVQTDLFQRKATFKFIPYDGDLVMAHDRIGRGAAWTSFLPPGAQPQLHQTPRPTFAAAHTASAYVDLAISNVPALVDEPYMPPVGMMRYRVEFYYTVDAKPDVYWKEEGKLWNKDVEKFLDRNAGVSDAVSKAVLPSDSPEMKVRKIYALVTGFENQTYKPARTEVEEKVLGLKANAGTEDVLRQRSGDHDELNRLFVAMVRSAGIPASMMWVTSREETFFQRELLSTHQLEAEIAIVQLGSKDVFLDPGTKFCPYGLLDWRYSGSRGLRQMSGKEPEFAESPFTDYNQAQIQRLARLQLGDDGKAEGIIKIGFFGLEAMDRRQKANSTDDEGRKKLLEDEVKSWFPAGSDVTLTGTPNWNDTEPHLATEFKVSIPLGAGTGKRLLVPVHVFQVNEKPVFPASERVNPIYLWYQTRQIDEVHITLPPGLEVENLPANDSVKLDYAVYSTIQKQESPGSIMSHRDFAMAGVAFPATAYKELKSFYEKAGSGDEQQMILKTGAHGEAR
jgi:hypothetical protein